MPGTLVHVGAQMLCPHGGQISAAPGSARVKVGGQPVATVSDTYAVAGCPFTVPTPGGPKPQPCVRATWTSPSTRIRTEGKAVLLQSSTGICQSGEQIPQGPPQVASTQPRARGK